jgi:5'(3')-deoxyribonucleotidase
MKQYKPILKEISIPYKDELLYGTDNESDEGHKYQIFLDLDGTIADFDEYFKFIVGIYPDQYEKENGDNSIWAEINDIDHFWAKLPLIPGAEKLIRILKKYNLTILTAPSDRVSQCKSDKLQWVRKYVGGNIPVIFEKQKEKYSGKNGILIDDMLRQINNWKNKGGIGILYKSTPGVIIQLEKLNIK